MCSPASPNRPPPSPLVPTNLRNADLQARWAGLKSRLKQNFVALSTFIKLVRNSIAKISLYARENRALVGSLTYLYLCAMGIIYDNTVFYLTGINPIVTF
jgi:hypothetical protein